ncbi:MAG: hypothetical protein UR28_C0034G0001, partial [Candidatus Peregrinibacteria bacterium GW2011_GWF2_33_10]
MKTANVILRNSKKMFLIGMILLVLFLPFQHITYAADANNIRKINHSMFALDWADNMSSTLEDVASVNSYFTIRQRFWDWLLNLIKNYNHGTNSNQEGSSGEDMSEDQGSTGSSDQGSTGSSDQGSTGSSDQGTGTTDQGGTEGGSGGEDMSS